MVNILAENDGELDYQSAEELLRKAVLLDEKFL